MQDIFLSYSTQDRDRLTPLVDALEAQGWTVFWDHRSIKVADDWHEVVGTAIQQCACVIVVWSEASVSSGWVKEEALIARDRDVLYPVRIDQVAMPFGFTMIQAADFTAWDGRTEHHEFVRLKEQLAVRLDLRSVESLPQSVPVVEVAEPPPAVAKLSSGGSGFKVAAVVVTLFGAGFVGYQFIGDGSDEQVVAQSVVDKPVAVLAAPAPVETPKKKKLDFEPTMLKIEGGEFQMGCDPKRDDVEGGCDDSEKPLHKVTVPKFLLAETEVTVAQYQACIDAGSCPEPEWREKGSDYNIKTGKDDRYKKLGNALTGDNYPVVGVSWDNAQTYVQWLKKKTGKNYRLPTEAEWEYAARAGKGTAYSWGNAIGENNANCGGGSCGDSYEYTSPVGSFSDDPMVLKDMHGNVWEWVQDRWHTNYAEAPANGTASEFGNSTVRVLRSGSFAYGSQALRSAHRTRRTYYDRDNYTGFRPAQDYGQ